MRIRIWSLDLTTAGEISERWLSAVEQERARRFVHEPARRRFVAGRALTRRIIANALGLEDPRAVELTIAAGGRPEIRGATLRFSLAHSGERVMLGLASIPFGVDVERRAPERVTAALASRCLTARECEGTDARAFFELWAAKEACMKATGLGLGLPARSFAVPRPCGDAGPALVDTAPGHPAAGLGVCWLYAGDGYAAAVAAPGTDWGIELTTIEPEAVGCR